MSKREKFIDHLNKSKDIVSEWPEWKRILMAPKKDWRSVDIKFQIEVTLKNIIICDGCPCSATYGCNVFEKYLPTLDLDNIGITYIRPVECHEKYDSKNTFWEQGFLSDIDEIRKSLKLEFDFMAVNDSFETIIAELLKQLNIEVGRNEKE